MLSEISQMEKGKYCVVSYVNCRNKTNKQMNQNRNRLIGTEYKWVITRRGIELKEV